MLALSCAPATFGNVSLFGAEILSLQTSFVTNYTISVPASVRFTQPSVEVQNASFCNITVTYTHPGQDDVVNFEAWLPAEGWNGRLQAVGGGGWVAGRSEPFYSAMGGAIADGYATITTDAGLGNSLDASSWALLSPGNVNLYNLQNLASVSLDDGVSHCITLAQLALLNLKPIGNHWKVSHQVLLRSWARLLLLEWLLSGGASRIHAGTALSNAVRWHCCRCSRDPMDRFLP